MLRIAVIAVACFVAKGLRVMSFAVFGVVFETRLPASVDHVPQDLFAKLWHRFRRNLGANDFAVLAFVFGLVGAVENQKDVPVRKATFLKLNHVYVRDDLAENVSLQDILHQLLKFLTEDASTYVRPMMSFLSLAELPSDFESRWVAGKCYEQVRLAKSPHHSHVVFVSLMQVPRSTAKR